jgi:hypothetical protein
MAMSSGCVMAVGITDFLRLSSLWRLATDARIRRLALAVS